MLEFEANYHKNVVRNFHGYTFLVGDGLCVDTVDESHTSVFACNDCDHDL